MTRHNPKFKVHRCSFNKVVTSFANITCRATHRPSYFISWYFGGARLQVFDEIGTAVIDQAFAGYNATVFAYGQVHGDGVYFLSRSRMYL